MGEKIDYILKVFFSVLFLLIVNTNIFCQSIPERLKLEKSVTEHLSTIYHNYTPISFGECFNQTYANEVQEKIRTKKVVMYTIVHTYSIGNNKNSDIYFHLDANYKVVGHLTSEEMDKINSDMLNKSGKLDSLFNTIDLPSN